MKPRIFIIFLLTVCHSPLSAQSYLASFAKSVGFITFIYKNNPTKQSSGTGTLILHFTSDTSAQALLVTNRHVLPAKPNENDSIHFRIRNYDSFVDISIPVFQKNGSLSDNVKTSPDGEDVAVINVTHLIQSMGNILEIIRNGATDLLRDSQLATPDTLKRLNVSIGEDVLFVGYPSLFYDSRNISPILRQAIIATDPTADFYFNNDIRFNYIQKFGEPLPTKLTGFLVDGNLAGGSSGSLVLLKPMGIVSDPHLGNVIDPRRIQVYILGLSTYSYFDIDNRISGPARVNLGGVISSSSIRNTIALFGFPSYTLH